MLISELLARIIYRLTNLLGCSLPHKHYFRLLAASSAILGLLSAPQLLTFILHDNWSRVIVHSDLNVRILVATAPSAEMPLNKRGPDSVRAMLPYARGLHLHDCCARVQTLHRSRSTTRAPRPQNHPRYRMLLTYSSAW
ncbi:hypothetical protein C8Q80DRAFT_474025 [Daedaleopsis nitida]|nr:hypothetical protein C8Q80DRAFT_474025 [Daedaleopsis nitida]